MLHGLKHLAVNFASCIVIVIVIRTLHFSMKFYSERMFSTKYNFAKTNSDKIFV